MATYYWVGGTGTWDAATTTNWASSSGGSGGAGVPTVNDDVVFNTASNATAYTVTINAGICRNWTLAGPASGNVTVAGTTTMTVAGSVAWATVGITRTFTNTIIFNSTTPGKTVDFGGITLANALTFSGVGGGWAFTRNLTNGTGNTITLTAGTLDMRGYAFTTGGIASNNSNVRTLLIDATTTLTLTGATTWSFQTTTNLTVDFTNVTITNNGNATFNAGNLSYGTILFTSNGSGTHTITGSPTVNTLTFTSRSATGTRTIRFGGNPTITNLTLGTANQIIRRLYVGSDTQGLQRTLNVTTLVSSLADIDFQDINVAGTMWSGTRLGDCGNNNNITFDAARTVYWNLPAGGVVTAAAWALTSGGTASVNTFPLPQDTIVIQNTGLNTGATITVDTDWKFGSIDASTRTNAMTLAHSTVSFWMFGDINLPSTVTLSGTTGSYYIAGYNKTLNPILSTGTHAFPIQFIAPYSVVNLQSNLINTSTSGIFLYAGTLNLNGYDITARAFTSSSTSSVPRTLAFGTNVLNITGNAATVWNVGTATTLVYTGNPIVNFTYSGATGTRTFGQGVMPTTSKYPTFNITAGSDILSFSTHYVNDLNFTGFSGTWTTTGAGFISGNLQAVPAMTVGALGGSLSFVSNTSGVKSIILAGKTFDQSFTFNGNGGAWALSDPINAAVTRTLTLSAGTLYTNNQPITIGAVSSPNTAATRVLDMSNTTWTITAGSTPWNIPTSNTITLMCGNTSSITFTNNSVAAVAMDGGSLVYNDVYVPASTAQFVMYGNNTFRDLTIDVYPAIGRKIFIHQSNNLTVSGTFTLNGAQMTRRPFILTTTYNNSVTFYANNVAGLDYCDFRRIHARGPSIPWSGIKCSDVVDNENIIFEPPKTVYWNQVGGGNWSDAAWALTSGGTASIDNFPLAQDTIIFDDVGLGSNSTVNVDVGWQFGSLDTTQVQQQQLTLSLSNNTPDVAGNLFFGSTTSVLSNGTIYMSSRDQAYFSAPNTYFPSRLDIQPIPVGAQLTLQSNVTLAGNLTFAQNTLNLNNYVLTCNTFISNTVTNRTINFGDTGEIQLTGSNTTANGNLFIWNCAVANNMTLTGSRTVRLTYNGSVGIRTIYHGQTSGATEANAPDIYIGPGNDNISYGTTSASRSFIADDQYTGILGIPTTIYGDLYQSANSRPTASAIGRFFSGTQGPYSIRLNGTSLDRPIAFNGGGTYILADNFVGGTTPGAMKSVWLQSGTLTAAANVTVGAFFANTNEDLPRTLNMGNGTWTIAGDDTSGLSGTGSMWQFGEYANNLTVNAGNSTVRMIGSSHKRFNAAGKTFNNIVQAGTGNLRIQHRGIFNTISNEVDGTLVTFLENETVSFANIALSNTTISSVDQSNTTPAGQFTLQLRTGRDVTTQDLTIGQCDVVPAGYLYATNSTDAGNTSGIVFGARANSNARMMSLLLPSF